jgi:hypothetical protein
MLKEISWIDDETESEKVLPSPKYSITISFPGDGRSTNYRYCKIITKNDHILTFISARGNEVIIPLCATKIIQIQEEVTP